MDRFINEYTHWRAANLCDEDGVIVASSRDLEWLLPWWWINYRLHNDHPVTFVNFSMSEGAIAWCRKRGEVVSFDIPDDFIVKKENIDPAQWEIWHRKFKSSFWDFRANWIKKPLALLKSPYRRTIWFDLDCQVRKPIKAMFETCENPSGVALADEPELMNQMDIEWGIALPGEKIYNSGVVVYKREASLINKWAAAAVQRNNEFYGDQEIISRIIHEEKPLFGHLPTTYNWVLLRGENPDAAVLHWAGSAKHNVVSQIKALSLALRIQLGILPSWI